MAFKYHKRSSESVSRRAKQSSGAYDNFLPSDVVSFKPREGENAIRIVPWLSDDNPDAKKLREKWDDHWGIDIHLHRNVGPDNGSYLCLDKMLGEPCPVCEARREASEEEADAWRVNTRILCWVVDRDAEKTGPQLWAMPLGTSKDISAASTVRGSGDLLLIDHPEEGYDIFFEREGEKKRTRYKQVQADRNSTPLSDNQKTADRWLKYVSDNLLPDLLEYFPYDHIEKVLHGQASSKRSEDDEEGGDNKRSSRRLSGRGDGDQDSDAETEGNERSSRRSRRGGEEAEGEFKDRRGASRTRGRSDEDPPEEEEGEEQDNEAEEAMQDKQARRRRSSREEPEEEDQDEETGERERPARGKGQERYRGGGKKGANDDEEQEGGDSDGEEEEVTTARSRLRGIRNRRR